MQMVTLPFSVSLIAPCALFNFSNIQRPAEALFFLTMVEINDDILLYF